MDLKCTQCYLCKKMMDRGETHESVEISKQYFVPVCQECQNKWGSPIPKPLVRLASFLSGKHPENYKVSDVCRSIVRGYLHTLIPCKCFRHPPQFHSISISNAYYPPRTPKGQFQSPYRLWNELDGILKTDTVDDFEKRNVILKRKIKTIEYEIKHYGKRIVNGEPFFLQCYQCMESGTKKASEMALIVDGKLVGYCAFHYNKIEV